MVDKDPGPRRQSVKQVGAGTLKRQPSSTALVEAVDRTRNRIKIKALEAFEAVSRHLSSQKAAKELGVTSGAVNHHIRYLAEELNDPLFIRSGKKFALTETGKVLASRVQAAFAEIDRTIVETKGVRQDVVRLALCSSFGPGWMIKRIGRFYSRYPQIDLQLILYAQHPDIASFGADAFITNSSCPPGFLSIPLQPEYLIAVCAGPASSAIGRLPLISKTLGRDPLIDDWVTYTQQAEIELAKIDTFPRITASHFLLAYEMARRNIGIALVPDFLTEEDLISGVVSKITPIRIATGRVYTLCIKESRRTEPSLRSLMEWLRSESSIFDPR